MVISLQAPYAMTSRTDSLTTPVPAAINIMDVISGVGRRKALILGLTLSAFAIGMAAVTLLKPVYKSEAQVLIQNLETPFDRVQPTENQRADAIDDRIVASQISVLKSQDLGRRVVAALALETKPEFNSLIDGQGTLGKLKIRLGFGSDPSRKTPEQRALDRYLDKLNVFQLPESNVVGIEYTSSDPDIAATIANTLADTYVLWTRESQSQPTVRARDWLSAQIDGLRKRLADSEAAVERFRTEAGLLKGATATLGEQEISELNSQISVARGARLEARARADAIRSIMKSRGSADSATDVLNSSTVQRLKEQRTDATRRMAELSVTYLSNHPKMVAVRNEISNIDRQIRSETIKIVNSLEEQARIAESREQSLVASLDALKTQESTANLDDVKLKALERDAGADRALLEAMLSRYAEASARQDLASQPGLAVVIQNASVATAPSFPKTGPMVTLITIAGLAMSLGIAFLLELMAAASRMGEVTPVYAPVVAPALTPVAAPAPELPQQRSDPVLQSIAATPPKVPKREDLPPQPAAMPPAAASTATVEHLTIWPRVTPQADLAGIMETAELQTATQDMARWLQDIRRDLDVRRVGLTSLGAGSADAPVAAVALARHIAITGRRVVLVDLARHASLVGGLCGVAAGPGVADLVSGNAEFTKVIARDNRSPIHVLRYGLDHSPRASSLLLDRIDSVLSALAQAYDLVLVNLGEAGEETPVYLHKCQAALLLAPASREAEAAAAAQTLTETGLPAARHVLIGSPAGQPLQAVNG